MPVYTVFGEQASYVICKVHAESEQQAITKAIKGDVLSVDTEPARNAPRSKWYVHDVEYGN